MDPPCFSVTVLNFLITQSAKEESQRDTEDKFKKIYQMSNEKLLFLLFHFLPYIPVKAVFLVTHPAGIRIVPDILPNSYNATN